MRLAVLLLCLVSLRPYPVRADRYDDLGTSWINHYRNGGPGACTSTDAMTLAWACMGSFHGFCYGYEISQEQGIIDRERHPARPSYPDGVDLYL